MILDKVWMLVLPDNAGVVYEIGTSAQEVWDKVIRNETLGTGVTKEMLQKRGYKTRRVTIHMDYITEHLQLALEQILCEKEKHIADQNFNKASDYRDAGDAIKKAIGLIQKKEEPKKPA
jgi:hypothetical protein